jgi:ABC-2 type transport system permease protein
MSAVIRRLVVKELYLNRWLMTVGAVAGLASAAIASHGRVGFNVGALTWLTTVIAVGIMLALNGVVNERKEQALLFVLSLPLSPAGYVRAKLAGLGLCFLVPWAASTAAAVLLVLADEDIPDGLLPYTLLLSVYLLVNFSVVLCGTLLATSEAVVTATVIGTNMSVSLYMFTIVNVRGIGGNLEAARAVWSGPVWVVLAVEAAVLGIAAVLPLIFAARRRDFV